MATEPLFVASMEVLLSLLKLNQVEGEGSTLQIIEETLRDVTVSFYRKLGHDRVVALKAITIVDPPTTDNEYLAILARITERKWVKLKLLRELPILFANPGNQFSEYNEEAPYVESSEGQLNSLIKALSQEIEENLELLSTEETATNETTIKASAIGPTVVPLLPGDTAWGS